LREKEEDFSGGGEEKPGHGLPEFQVFERERSKEYVKKKKGSRKI